MSSSEVAVKAEVSSEPELTPDERLKFLVALQQLVDSQQFTLAESIIREELAKTPKDLELLSSMTSLLISMGRDEEAEAVLRQQLAIDPLRFQCRLQLMQLYGASGRHDALVRECESALSVDADSVQIRQQLIATLVEQCEFERALEHSRVIISQLRRPRPSKQEIDSNPYIDSTLLTELPTVDGSSEPKKAKSHSDAIDSETTDSKKTKAKAESETDVSATESAASGRFHAEDMSASARKATLAEATMSCGQILAKLGNFAEAIKVSEKGIELTADSHEDMHKYYGFLGLCYKNNDQLPKAKLCFEKSRVINPKDPVTVKNLVSISKFKMQFEQAAKMKDKARSLLASKKGKNLNVDSNARFFGSYLQLLLQLNRVASAKLTMEQLISVRSNIRSPVYPMIVIMFESTLSQEVFALTSVMSSSVDRKRADGYHFDDGPMHVTSLLKKEVGRKDRRKASAARDDSSKKEERSFWNGSSFLVRKVWRIRAFIDELYRNALSNHSADTTVRISYVLSMWRLGYSADGVIAYTNPWLKSATCAIAARLKDKAQLFQARGNAYLSEDRNSEAVIQLKIALKVVMEKMEALKKHMLASASGSVQLEIQRKAQQLKGEEIQNRLLLTAAYNKLDKVKEALEECNRILKMAPTHMKAMQLQATLQRKLGNYDSARKQFEGLLKASPSDRSLIHEYIELLIETNDLDAAKLRLERMLTQNADDTAALLKYGGVLIGQRQYREAVQVLEKVLCLNPDSYAARNNLLSAISKRVAVVKSDIQDTECMVKMLADAIEARDKAVLRGADASSLRQFTKKAFEESKVQISAEAQSRKKGRKKKSRKAEEPAESGYAADTGMDDSSEESAEDSDEKSEEKSDSLSEQSTEKRRMGELKTTRGLLKAKLAVELKRYEKYMKECLRMRPSVVTLKLQYIEFLWSNERKEDAFRFIDSMLAEVTRFEVESKCAKASDSEIVVSRAGAKAQLAAALYTCKGKLLLRDRMYEAVTAAAKQKADAEIEAVLKNALVADNSCVEAISLMGSLRMAQLRFKDALQSFKKALSLEPMNASVRIQLSEMIRKVEVGCVGANKAMDLLKEGLKRQPNSVLLMEQLLKVLAFVGRNQEAEKLAWKLLKVRVTSAAALRCIAQTCDDKVKVKALFEGILKENPESVEVMVTYGSWCFAHKEYETGLPLLNRAIVLDPTNCEAHYLKGFTLLQKKMHKKEESASGGVLAADRYTEALECMRTAVKVDATNIYAHVNLSQLLARTGQLSEAWKHANEAYQLDSSDPVPLAQYIKMTAHSAIETGDSCEPIRVNRELLLKAFALANDALQQFPGHVNLLIARSLVTDICAKSDIELPEMAATESGDALTDAHRFAPQTAYGMLGVSVMKP